ncbi:hypothetical protein POTOM_053944 [Populus tomentosa]|uniref:Rapid ALkalinization Factor n=1 Tax=Populus tomentosa TaxID=118781 RepID=A0A8X8C6M0_POPTO|nr:hypothetical protein POTOM_053944 [Populus tomentosa]
MKSLALSALTSSLLLMMLLNTISCGASISLPKMDGDLPLYSSIADSNMDLEFMMDSEINRILIDSRNAGASYPATDPHGIPLYCGQSIPYMNCLGAKKDNRCPPYKRDCTH